MMDKRTRMKRSRFSSEESRSSSMSSSMTSSSSSDEETDAKDLKPIKEYLSNRKELASQLFKSVKAEKIRMMLPQILKKIDFSDLEELCANELTGMSKTRITSILNGQEMLQSSDTNDSDDSGPSLEIISDTEWLSDDGTSVKVEGVKAKRKSKKPDAKSKNKLNKNGKVNAKVKLEKVKTEGKAKEKAKEKEKDKEGESLLDLLELEMRARAIKALLRKEDSPSTAKSGNSSNQASGSGLLSEQARQANLKEQLEKIDVLMKHGDDEDVYVVINPAPTIELLSSDEEKQGQSKKSSKPSESEAAKVGDQQQASASKERENGAEKAQEKEEETVLDKLLNAEKDANDKSAEAVVNEKKGKDARGKDKAKDNGNSNLPMSVIESSNDDKAESPKAPAKEEELEEGEIVDNEDDHEKERKKEAKVQSPSKDKIKKVKKNPNIRSKKHRKPSDSESDGGGETRSAAVAVVAKKEEMENNEPIEIADSPERKNSHASEEDDDKALDIEEIINLDDYPDDDEVDEPPQQEQPKETQPEVKQPEPTGSETWASRYVQQDEVQSVIRESKIQSEIRKRLRERQRQSKLNSSPKEAESATPEPVVEVPKPTGSVEEYLALKRLADGDSSSTADEEKSNQEKIELAVETPVVIVRKPQLIVPTKVEEQQQVEEQLNVPTKVKEQSNVEEQSNVPTKLDGQSNVVEQQQVEETNVAVKEEQSVVEKTPEKSVVIKEDSPLTSTRVVLVKPRQEESPAKRENSSPPREDPNSDSSDDDNVVVKIDSSSWTEQASSELRPD